MFDEETFGRRAFHCKLERLEALGGVEQVVRLSAGGGWQVSRKTESIKIVCQENQCPSTQLAFGNLKPWLAHCFNAARQAPNRKVPHRQSLCD